ncbi:hypothetical protein TRICI_000413 [Trichomonascus ciferrii]|uniref:Uncharacterized protein n=1 Tax=Trichomonascus ciferrii TaxID=44093 RepID=A0A642VDK1_9ASCO|nr:hypothetical protein TRICI_000413 [Trichomonascus ciferrii]
MEAEDDGSMFTLLIHGPGEDPEDPFERWVAADSLLNAPRDAYFLLSNIQTLTCQFYKSGTETLGDRTKLEALAIGLLNQVENAVLTRLYYINLLGLFFPEHLFLLATVDAFTAPLCVRAEIFPTHGNHETTTYSFHKNIRDVAIAVRQDDSSWPRDRSPVWDMFRVEPGHVMDVVSLHNLGAARPEQIGAILGGASSVRELLLERTGVVGIPNAGGNDENENNSYNDDDFLTQVERLRLKYARMRLTGAHAGGVLREIDAEHVSLDFFRTYTFSHVTSLRLMLFPEQNLKRGLLRHFPQLLDLTLRLPMWEILFAIPDEDLDKSLVSRLMLEYHCRTAKSATPSPHPHSLIRKLERLQRLEHLELTSNYDKRRERNLDLPLLNETLYMQIKRVLVNLKTLRFSKRFSVQMSSLDFYF